MADFILKLLTTDLVHSLINPRLAANPKNWGLVSEPTSSDITVDSAFLSLSKTVRYGDQTVYTCELAICRGIKELERGHAVMWERLSFEGDGTDVFINTSSTRRDLKESVLWVRMQRFAIDAARPGDFWLEDLYAACEQGKLVGQ